MKNHVKILLFSLLIFSLEEIAGQSNKSSLYKEFSLELKSEYRYFFEDGLYPGQKDHYPSLAIEPELFLEWDDGKQLFKFTGFARWDAQDSRRTHWDIRELYWQKVANNWELSIGLKKIFWGVTESVHLVDIINQTDAIESFDGEQKLGQPMVHFSYLSSFGTFDFFGMPYTRKRQFPGEKGRFRFPFDVERDDIGFQNTDLEEYYPSFALRWSHAVGIFDMGLSHYYGVGREPLFLPIGDGSTFNLFYPIIHQTGLDLQATTGPWIWKLESILRFNEFQDVFALAGGFEYTFGNIGGSGLDIGLLGEYLYDDRGELAFGGLNNDIFIGSRLAFNDTQSTEILFGGIFDLERSTKLFSIEANRRIGESWKLTLETRILTAVSSAELTSFFQNDSFFQLSLSKFF